jgi:menaquinone-dependent protoporphyrinogen oxidase
MAGRVLVVYGTTEGHTAKIAAAVAARLRELGGDADVVEAGSEAPGPDGYDGVVVAASIHAGEYQRSLRRWVRTHADGLNRMPSAFISVCLGVLQHDESVRRHLDEMQARFQASTGWQPASATFVAGALAYTRYGWVKRQIMKRIAAAAGGATDTTRDVEYTDWTELAAFVTAWSASLRAGAMAG